MLGETGGVVIFSRERNNAAYTSPLIVGAAPAAQRRPRPPPRHAGTNNSPYWSTNELVWELREKTEATNLLRRRAVRGAAICWRRHAVGPRAAEATATMKGASSAARSGHTRRAGATLQLTHSMPSSNATAKSWAYQSLHSCRVHWRTAQRRTGLWPRCLRALRPWTRRQRGSCLSTTWKLLTVMVMQQRLHMLA